MSLRSPRIFVVLIAALALSPSVFAFMPNPDLLVISPPVAKAGETREVTISGTNLDEASGLHFSHPGITAKQVMTPADEFYPKPQPVANRFQVTVAENVPPGIYEVRSKGYFGLSTARPFYVFTKDALEIVEEGDHSTPETGLPLKMEEGVFGTIDGGKFDWYTINAKKDERILLHIWAERLDSKADVLLAVYDSTGRELESSRHHFGRDPFIDFIAPSDGAYHVSITDVLYNGGSQYFYHFRASRSPHIDFVFPPAGVPGSNTSFTLYGRNLPGGSLGEDAQLDGKPIETKPVTITVPNEVSPPDSFHWANPREGMLPAFEYSEANTNTVRIGFSDAPITKETPSTEDQKIPFPTEVAGRFDEPGDSDSYLVHLKKGTPCWVEAISERLGAATDPFVLVEKMTPGKDGAPATPTKVAENDDPPSFYGRDSLDDLNGDTLDSMLSFTADADADYRISIINQRAGGSLAHLYRLAVRGAKPDYQLMVGKELTKTINNDAYPAAPLLRKGGSMVFRIIALRKDGFEGDITVTVSGLPAGVQAQPLVLSGDSTQGFLTLQADANAAPWSGPITISGKAKIGEAEKVVDARPASIIWGKRVFARSSQVRSRLDVQTVLSVIDTETEPCRIKAAEDKVYTVKENEDLEIPIEVADVGTRTGNMQVNVHGFPGMLRSPPTVSVGEKDKKATIKISFKKSGNFEVKPGRFQFVLQGVGNANYEQNPAAVKRLEAETKRLASLEKSFTNKLNKAKADSAKADKELTVMQQKANSAADDNARAALKQELDAATKRATAAKKLVTDLDAKVKKATSLKASADKEFAKAEATAKEKSNQFATFSMPITVEVAAAEKK